MPLWFVLSLIVIATAVALAIGVLACAVLWSAIATDAPWAPLSRRAIRTLVNLIGPLPDGTTVVDMGSGDGRVLRAIARHNAAMRGIGIEQSYLLTALARRWSALGGYRQLSFARGNFKQTSLRGTEVVTCYLWSNVMPVLGEKFQRELAPGSRVFSVAFAIPGWHPHRTVAIPNVGACYEYVIDQNKAQSAKLTSAGFPVTIEDYGSTITSGKAGSGTSTGRR